MKTMTLLATVVLGTVAVTLAVAVQDAPPMPAPAKSEQHAWLRQFVGEWSCKAEVIMAPGDEPMRFESTESVRSIGGMWILAESSADFDGAPFTSILTLGYDPAEEAFVGTWIDTMQARLWTYRGALDEAKKVLTLEAEGPLFSDPTKSARYRDAIELVSADHKVMSSSVEGEDGTWTSYMRAEYRRKE